MLTSGKSEVSTIANDRGRVADLFWKTRLNHRNGLGVVWKTGRESNMPNKRDSRAPVERPDGTVSRHERVIRELLDSDSNIHRHGFAKAVRSLWIELCDDDEEAWSDMEIAPVLPDAYKLDRTACEILIYEVEDTCPVSDKKLWEYALMWMRWDGEDAHDWLPRLFTIDARNPEPRELDLCRAWYDLWPSMTLPTPNNQRKEPRDG